MNCRSRDVRKQIVELYDLEVITYSIILNGREKKSCTGDILTDQYYEFLCKLKSDNKKTRIITCGYTAGEHFLQLCNLDKPKIFNPLIDNEINYENNRNNIGNTRDNTQEACKWNILAYELYIALNWLSICWDKPLIGHLLEKKINIKNNPTEEPSESVIRAVNTSIGKGKRSLTEMINEIRKDNEIREYTFNYLNVYIEKLNENIENEGKKIKSFF